MYDTLASFTEESIEVTSEPIRGVAV